MEKKLIIFDLDGTLFNTKESYKYILADILNDKWNIDKEKTLESFNKTFSEIENPEKYESTREYYEDFNEKFLEKITNPDKNKKQKFKEIIKEVKQIAPVKLKPFPLVKETIKSLKERDYKLAILTGKKEEKIEYFKNKEHATKKKQELEKLLSNSGLNEYIDKTFITYEYSTIKPHSKAFQIVLDYFEVSPEEAIMVGDREEDMAAFNTGIKTILFNPNNEYEGKITPDYEIKDFSELPKVIEKQ